MLALDFMRQALVAAVLVGIAAPMIGVFLVQRRLSLIGDGIGHVALAGRRRRLPHRASMPILVTALALSVVVRWSRGRVHAAARARRR
jgi:zinc transport system permease protein